MAFRVCFAITVVLYMAVLLVQIELSASVSTNNTPSNNTNSTVDQSTPVANTSSTLINTTVDTTTKATGGVEGMFSAASIAIYALCSALVAMM